MKQGKDYIIERFGAERYEEIKARQRVYEKEHKLERNAYKAHRRAEKTKKLFGVIQDLEGEVWKVIEGTDGAYAISNYGRCKAFNYKNTQFTKLLKASKCSPKSKYYRFSIKRYGKHMSCKVHRLVAEAFIPNPNNYPDINHKDENPGNNVYTNLEWCNAKYNNNYGTVKERKAESKKRPIIAYVNDRDTYVIWFSSTADAAEMLTGNRLRGTNITAIINGHGKSYLGLKWKYERDK